MIFTDDEKNMFLLGEAAMQVLLKEKEINVNAIVSELSLMAENEVEDERVEEIFQTKLWLDCMTNAIQTDKDCVKACMLKSACLH
jgi:hypothetical protein